MAGNFQILIDDVLLYIMQYLGIHDRISFSFTCKRLRQICIDGKVFRKVDISRNLMVSWQEDVIRKFFRDRQMMQHIRELDLSNRRFLHGQIDFELEEFIFSICPQLEALHVLDWGMNLERLQCLLQQSPKLTALSWSLRELTYEDIEFLKKVRKSPEGISLKSIRHLHLDILMSQSHLQVLKYLVLSSCKDLEELEVCIWITEDVCHIGRNNPFRADEMIPGFRQPSTSVTLQQLHSLTVVAAGGSYSCSSIPYNEAYREQLCDFVLSVIGKKSSIMKWRKLWISPPIDYRRQQGLVHLTDSAVPIREDCPHELHSVEAIAAHPANLDSLNKLFQMIGDNTVRELHLCHPTYQPNLILELYEPILRVGEHTLKFLSLSFNPLHRMIDAEEVISFHTLFSNCLNITELDILFCYFEKDICEPLSKLRHLTRVQLMQCAVSSKYNRNEVEISKGNLLTFVDNCKNITHFDVRGCSGRHKQFSCNLTDGDLLALAKLCNLKSLTIFKISDIREWTFLQNISENCKFLTMLRISAVEHFHGSHIQILFENAKFLKHLAIKVPKAYLRSEEFWSFVSLATNLERLCIKSDCKELLRAAVAVKTVRNLPRLKVLHLHSCHELDVVNFVNQMRSMLQTEDSDRRHFFELVIPYTWFRFQSDCWISEKVLPLNIVELCHMAPVLAVPRF